MLDLGQHADEGFVSLRTISERQEVSLKYLEAIVCDLKKADLIESTRGKEGGYRLARAPEDLTVGEILRTTEDSLAPVACIKTGEVQCERSNLCSTLPMWQELGEITNRFLDSITLRDLITGERWK